MKTHYRKVFKSDHLGQADLEDLIEQGKRLVFTITHVKQEINVMVAGHKGNFNIAYFKEDIKPLVLNAVNSKRMRQFNNNSPFVEDWANTVVELYIDKNVKLMGDVVGGVRIKPNQPTISKPKLTPQDTEKWSNAIKYLNGKGTIENILTKYTITEADKDQLLVDAMDNVSEAV